MRTAIFLILLSLVLARPAWALSLSGRLLDPASVPVQATSVSFVVQVRTPGSEDCLLFKETHTRNMSSSNGLFSITLGDGTASIANSETVNGATSSLDTIFQNRKPMSFPLGACTSGTSYNPGAADGRLVVIQFNDGSGWQTFPSTKIARAPQASDAMTVGGYKGGELLRVHDASGDPVALSPWPQADYTKLLAIVSGSDTTYLKTESDPKVPTSCTTGQVMTYGSSAWTCGSAGGSPSGSAGGDLSSSYPNPSVAGIQSVAVSATAPSGAGQVLRYNGSTQYAPSFLSLADIRSTVTPANTMFPATACTAVQTLTWSSLTDTMSCANIAGLSASAISSGTFAIGQIPTGTTSTTVPLGNDSRFPSSTCASGNYNRWTGSSWSCDADAGGSSQWTTVSSDINYTAGKVGIGTAAPGYRLSVVESGTTAAGHFVNAESTDNPRASILLERRRADMNPPAAGFGADVRFNLEGFTDGSVATAGIISTQWENTQTNDSADRDGMIVFKTMLDNATATERMRIGSNGDVMIGTTSANAKFTVAGSNSSGIFGMSIGNFSNAASATSGIVLGNDSLGNLGLIYASSSGYTGTGGANAMMAGTLGNNPMGFMTNNTERVRILGDGKVGVATSSPRVPFEVTPQMPGGQWNNVAIFSSGNFGGGLTVRSYNDSGDPSLRHVALQAGESSYAHNIPNNVPRHLMLQPDGGNVGIGTTTPTSALHVAGTVTATSATVGSITVGTAGTGIAGIRNCVRNMSSGSISNGSSGFITVSCVGVNTNWNAFCSPYNGTSPTAGITWSSYASAADTVTINITNVSGSPFSLTSTDWKCTAMF